MSRTLKMWLAEGDYDSVEEWAHDSSYIQLPDDSWEDEYGNPVDIVEQAWAAMEAEEQGDAVQQPSMPMMTTAPVFASDAEAREAYLHAATIFSLLLDDEQKERARFMASGKDNSLISAVVEWMTAI